MTLLLTPPPAPLEVLVRSADEGIIISPDALVARHEALDAAARITAVASPEDQSLAVAAQAGLAKIIKATEKQRLELTRPVDELKKGIMRTAEAFIKSLKAEEMRVARLVGDYATAAQARERHAQNAINATLTRLEQDREAALSQEGLTHDDMQRIHEEYDMLIRAVPQVEVSRAEGQVVRQDWEVQVQDIHALYRSHPQCVKLTPLTSEIKALLNEGIQPRGVKAEKVTKSGVRAV